MTTKKTKKDKEVYIVGTSECGDLSQFYLDENVTQFGSLQSAKEGAVDIMQEAIDCGSADDIETVYVFKLVATGSKNRNITWDSK